MLLIQEQLVHEIVLRDFGLNGAVNKTARVDVFFRRSLAVIIAAASGKLALERVFDARWGGELQLRKLLQHVMTAAVTARMAIEKGLVV